MYRMYLRQRMNEKQRSMEDTGDDTVDNPPPKILVEGDEPVDKYTAGIELSNACRKFYVSRLQAAKHVKERLGLMTVPQMCTKDNTCDDKHVDKTCDNSLKKDKSSSDSDSKSGPERACTKQKSGIENAMSVLKREMASLIDQDLALMKQLLTLNEQIEELKWQRKLQGYSRGSLASSYMDSSVCTLSDVDCSSYELREPPPKYPSPSSLSLYDNVDNEECHYHSGSAYDNDTMSDLGSCDHMNDSVASLRSSGHDSCNDYKKSHGEQHSFDSGIHEPETPTTPTNGNTLEILL